MDFESPERVKIHISQCCEPRIEDVVGRTPYVIIVHLRWAHQ